MSKRFTDTNKYKKKFIRGLQGAYKLLWDYLYHDCDHAGIWHVDFDVAQIMIGTDMPISEKEAVRLFGDRIIQFDDGEKWFIPSFVEVQYGVLNKDNRAHKSVIDKLSKYGLNKPLTRSLQGRKDKDKDKDMDKEEEKEKREYEGETFDRFWNSYPVKKSKLKAKDIWKRKKCSQKIDLILSSIKSQLQSKSWREGFIPHPTTWLNGERLSDEQGHARPSYSNTARGIDMNGVES